MEFFTGGRYVFSPSVSQPRSGFLFSLPGRARDGHCPRLRGRYEIQKNEENSRRSTV